MRSRHASALRRSGLVALAAVVGPGVLAGLSDDDPPGITTYSILGADYGYELLWILLLSTLALALFHEVGARMGIATGQGITGARARTLRRPPCRPRGLGVARGEHRHDVRGVRRGARRASSSSA